MKTITGLIGCCLALAVLSLASPCPADDAFLTSMGNILAMSDVNQSSSAPGLDVAGGEVSLRDQKPSSTNYLPKATVENDGFSYSDATETPAANVRTAGDSRYRSQISDSPIERFLLITITGCAIGLVLIAAGIAQFWRRRSIRNYWLFPAVQEDGEPVALGNSSPPQLIAKKQMETLPEEKLNKRAQRRAA
jgi:hypothetical protein